MENEVILAEGATFNAAALRRKWMSVVNRLSGKDVVIGSLEQSKSATRCSVVVGGCVIEFSMMSLGGLV